MARDFQIDVRYNRLPRLSAEMRRRVIDVVAKAARDVEANAKQGMQGPKSGAMYGNHQASAPGEAPAIDTGNLINSMDVSYENGGLTAYIGPADVEYGIYLEFGTLHMAPRPFMTPAAEKVRPAFLKAMKQVIE
jgi:HK97 gp10 family phage protein